MFCRKGAFIKDSAQSFSLRLKIFRMHFVHWQAFFLFLLLLPLLFMSTLFSAMKLLPWVIFWVYYASFNVQKQFGFLFSYKMKAIFWLIVLVFSSQWKLEFPQYMFYLKTRTSCVLKHSKLRCSVQSFCFSVTSF